MNENTNQPRVEIKFSSLSSLELWERLGLSQPRVEKKSTGEIFSPPRFRDEESKMAFEVFRQDCDISQEEEQEDAVQISEDKGGLFIWALLKEESKRSKKLSSVNHLFKNDVLKTMSRKGVRIGVEFEEADLDEICHYLEQKGLIKTSKDAIRITRKFASLFHEKYGAWLVF